MSEFKSHVVQVAVQERAENRGTGQTEGHSTYNCIALTLARGGRFYSTSVDRREPFLRLTARPKTPPRTLPKRATQAQLGGPGYLSGTHGPMPPTQNFSTADKYKSRRFVTKRQSLPEKTTRMELDQRTALLPCAKVLGGLEGLYCRGWDRSSHLIHGCITSLRKVN